MKIEIKHWLSGKIIFSHDCENNTWRLTVEAAVNGNISLDGARLDGARLVGARLVGARLDGARLVGARLDGARLDGARLVGARLDGARLDGARLVGARLDNGEKIVPFKKCEKPVFQIGGLGSAFRYLVAYLTEDGIRLRTGCFFGSIAQFEAKLKETHGQKGSKHALEYRAAIKMVKTHFDIWS
jgi:Pentapeptide repeats (8 copies)